MANWNLPTTTSGYLAFVDEMNAKFNDAVSFLGIVTPTNVPVGAMRFNRGINAFEEHTGSNNWVVKVLSVTGGGTSAGTPGGARNNFGLGSMSTQNSNAVAITGGTITGVNFSASDITGGIIALARGGTGASLGLGSAGMILVSNGSQVTFADGTYIPQLNASALVTGTVPTARLAGVAFVGPVINQYQDGGRNLFGGDLVAIKQGSQWSFGAYAANPVMNLQGSANPGGRAILRVININGDFHIQRVDDGYTVGYSLAIFTNEGYVQMWGGNISDINGAAITFGQINTARMGSGAANSGTFLRGDGTWAVPPTGGGGETPNPIPSGLIAMFATNCPVGWTRVASLDNRFPMGSTGFGNPGGNSQHSHGFSGSTDGRGGHSHGLSASGSGTAAGGGSTTDHIGTGRFLGTAGPFNVSDIAHHHDFSFSVNVPVTVNGNTDNAPDHAHNFSGGTGNADHLPPYLTVVYCQKD